MEVNYAQAVSTIYKASADVLTSYGEITLRSRRGMLDSMRNLQNVVSQNANTNADIHGRIAGMALGGLIVWPRLVSDLTFSYQTHIYMEAECMDYGRFLVVGILVASPLAVDAAGLKDSFDIRIDDGKGARYADEARAADMWPARRASEVGAIDRQISKVLKKQSNLRSIDTPQSLAEADALDATLQSLRERRAIFGK